MTLQDRQKWFNRSPNLAVGDLVIVEAPTLPPAEWKLGRVVETHSSSDQVVRMVTVHIQDGLFKRLVVKLVKLPVEV